MNGLRFGFWPLDEGEWKAELEDKVDNYSSEPVDLDAIRNFRDKEQLAHRWSDGFSSLLPSMRVSPMFVVWRNDKARVVTDHLASGLNDGIPRVEAKVRYDNMHDFGEALRAARALFPGKQLVVFKSDVASAFLNLPAHPIWQLRQVVSVDESFFVVRRLVFGNRASPRIWCAVSGLMCWIAVRKFNLDGICVYMDDFFGCDLADNLIPFRGMTLPWKQVQLLLLWDAIGCPWEAKKQLSDATLVVIGFWIDPNVGSISLSPSSVEDIVRTIRLFLDAPDRKRPLREWQRLAGHLNWLLNVLPWGRPALTELYRKIAGKEKTSLPLFLNREVISDMEWLIQVIPRAIGVRFIDEGRWHLSEADMVMWTDASLSKGLAFVFLNQGFVYPIRPSSSHIKPDIFFLELLAILSALHHAATLPHPPRRLLIWSDSLNSVEACDSLSVSESMHNAPLLAAAHVVLETGIDVRLRHIDGKSNIRADMLSRLMLAEYARNFPADRVCFFEPPRELLPARWRTCF